MYQRSPDTHNQTMPQRCLTKPHTELKHVVPKPHTPPPTPHTRQVSTTHAGETNKKKKKRD